MKTLLVFVILFAITTFFVHIPASAQEVTATPSVDPEVMIPLQATPIITMENKEIQYDLPYPGILPDNPLYFLKVIRDKVQEFFITDPLQRAVFDVMQSDKRMNASVSLSEEKPENTALISSTVSKALNYFEESISQTKQAKQQGEDIKNFASHMDTASLKYRQLILQLQTKSTAALKSDLEGDKSRIDSLHATVVSLEDSK